MKLVGISQALARNTGNKLLSLLRVKLFLIGVHEIDRGVYSFNNCSFISFSIILYKLLNPGARLSLKSIGFI